MSWISENKIPAAIIGVSAAGAIALGVMVFNAYSSYSTSLETFDNLSGSIARMKGAPLSPTPANVAVKTKSVTDYSAEVDRLSFVLHRLQKPDAPITNTEFQAKLKTTIAATRKLAAEHGVALPPEFNLAFEKYNAELPKSNELAAQLMNYLTGVDEIVHLLINSGVNRIDILERSELPAEKDTPPAPAPKAAPKAANKKGTQPGRPAGPEAAKITERYQVRAVVYTDQAALQVLIGKLSSPSETPNMPYFPILRLLRVENERQEGPLAAAVPPPPPPPPPPDPKGGVKPAAPDSIIILGAEKLKVFLEIDLVKFIDTQPAPSTR